MARERWCGSRGSAAYAPQCIHALQECCKLRILTDISINMHLKMFVYIPIYVCVCMYVCVRCIAAHIYRHCGRLRLIQFYEAFKKHSQTLFRQTHIHTHTHASTTAHAAHTQLHTAGASKCNQRCIFGWVLPDALLSVKYICIQQVDRWRALTTRGKGGRGASSQLLRSLLDCFECTRLLIYMCALFYSFIW